MKRIAVIITRMIRGGASTVVRQIIEGACSLHAKEEKYQFTLFTGTEDLDEKLISEISEYCSVIKVPSMIRDISPIRDYSAYRQLLCEFRRNHFDIVHTHTSKAGFIGRMAAAKAKIPTIIHTPHGTIYTNDSNIAGVPKFSTGKKVLQAVERFAGKRTTVLTTLSRHEKDICINLKLSKKENTVIIPNGINCAYFALTDQYKIKASKEFAVDKKDIVILSIGRLSSEKGHSLLIDAFAELHKKYSDSENLKMILLGEGPEKKNLMAQAAEYGFYSVNSNSTERLLANKVNFPGHACDIRKYLAVSDIAVIPSLYEGFGIVVIEAMAAGIPVIASDVGGIPEIITNGINGILFNPGSSSEIALQILNLIQNPAKRRNIIEEAKKRANFFSEKNMLDAYLKLYQ